MSTLHSLLDNLAAAGIAYGWRIDAIVLGGLVWALAAAVSPEGEELGEEGTIEHRWVPAMVTPTRHDDPPRRERVDQCLDRLDGEIRLVGYTDQRGLRLLRKRPQAHGDRSADALFRMRVLNRRQRKAG